MSRLNAEPRYSPEKQPLKTIIYGKGILRLLDDLDPNFIELKAEACNYSDIRVTTLRLPPTVEGLVFIIYSLFHNLHV